MRKALSVILRVLAALLSIPAVIGFVQGRGPTDTQES
jgi:hypothetical protein